MAQIQAAITKTEDKKLKKDDPFTSEGEKQKLWFSISIPYLGGALIDVSMPEDTKKGILRLEIYYEPGYNYLPVTTTIIAPVPDGIKTVILDGEEVPLFRRKSREEKPIGATPIPEPWYDEDPDGWPIAEPSDIINPAKRVAPPPGLPEPSVEVELVQRISLEETIQNQQGALPEGVTLTGELVHDSANSDMLAK